MLLKFTTPDMLNTSLVDVFTGERAYDIVTVLSEPTELESLEKEPTPPIPASSGTSASMPSSSQSPTPTMASSSPAFVKQSPANEGDDLPTGQTRRTTITNPTGAVVADVTWTGRRPSISILDEKIGALTDLFGSSTIRFMPKILAIPTRFDTEYIWTATADSLTLFDYDTETIRGTFHQNVIRIPTGSKASSKSKFSSPSRPILSSPSKHTLASASSSSTEESDQTPKCPSSAFIPTHLPGIGSNYLEYTPHPLAQDAEIILSFLMMEILRRGRFNLTPYTFEKPKLWQLKEARDLFMRRLRRNTV